MSIILEVINIVIPIHKLKKKCSTTLGNIEAFLDEQTAPGRGCWRDEHLYREGAMNSMDIQLRLEEWKRNGLSLTRKNAGILEWNDVCVVDSFSGPTLPCRWLKYNPDKQVVWLAGTPGEENYTPESIIFLHGKESTPDTSTSAQAVRDHFTNDTVLVPDYKPLERTHEEIEEYLADYIKNAGGDVSIVGISLGGYWAYRMGCKVPNVSRCIMLNPSFRCYPDIPVISARTGLPISIIVNMDDDIVNPADAIERFKERAYIKTFKKGGHRFNNRQAMLREIEKAINSVCD